MNEPEISGSKNLFWVEKVAQKFLNDIKPMPYSPDWEKEFDLQWAEDDEPRLRNFAKDFIHSLLQAREEWLRGEIERLIPEGTDEIVGAYWLKGRLLHLLTPKN